MQEPDPIPGPQRAAVRRLASFGTPPEVIRQLHGYGPAGVLLSPEDFKSTFARELAQGQATADADVSETLHLLAKEGKSVQATLAWAKQRLGWNDNTTLTENDARSQHDSSARALAALQHLMDELAARKSGSAAAADELAHHSAAQPAVAHQR